MHTLSGLLQHSHDARHVEISLCRAFCPARFLNTIFQLQKLVHKIYGAEVSTADSSYVVEGKITLVAIVQKSWFSFGIQNQEQLEELK